MANPPQNLTSADLHTLARLAGLDLDSQREPLVLAELNSQLANLRLVETLLPAPVPATALPYDPTFPPVSRTEEPTR